MIPDYDVIVVGGGTAGCASAIASARLGARTLLIERNHCLGGAATMRNVLTWCGLYTLSDTPQQAVRGVAQDVLLEQASLGGLGPITRFRGVFVPFDPEILKLTLDRLTLGAGVDLRFGATVVSANRDGRNITTTRVAHIGGTEELSAKAFVDCSGDGSLSAFGGASTRYGNSDGINLGTLGCRFGGISVNTMVTVDQLISSVANQNFPDGTISKDRCVVVRLPGSGDMVLYLASKDYDPRNGTDLANAQVVVREQAWQYLKAVKSIEGCENAYLVSTGPEIGTRESRHLNCRHRLTWSEVESQTSQDDVIALGAWGAEWHERDNYQSTFDYPPNRGTYEIPLRCLHSENTDNLFCAGRLADGDRKAGAAIRVMGTAMATGQAAGTAAALRAAGTFNVSSVQSSLKDAGAVLCADDI